MCRGRGAAAEPLTVAMNRLDLTSAARRSPLARPRQPPHRGNVLANLTAMLLASAIGFALGFGLLEETTTSIRQARLLSPLARAATYEVGAGPASAIRFPVQGPYDQRLGYTGVAEFTERLGERGYRVERQARQSAQVARLARWGLSPVYREKVQAGLKVLTPDGTAFDSPHPRHVFADFDDIARPIVDTLLFIEDRGLLSAAHPTRNPAVKWPRLVRATLSLGLDRLGLERSVPGASTLATQLEKLRHSPRGMTESPREKLRQMASASLRAYRYGADTTRARAEIVTDYLNSISLAAMPGYGEVIGLPTGLAVWFGADFAEATRLLRDPTRVDHATAQAYRRVLALLLAAGRPTRYLLEDRPALERRTDAYLRLLREGDVIGESLAAAADEVSLRFADEPPERASAERRTRASTSRLRAELLGMLGVRDLYELERLDLTVETSTVGPAQRMVESMLVALNRPIHQLPQTLRRQRLLASGDPRRVAYSVSLYELGEDVNRLRFHADSLDSPLDTNAGVMLDLGSTAKLRTLATYLELVAGLHDRLSGTPPDLLARAARAGRDALTDWAARELVRRPHSDKRALLAAAMQRRYSAAPGERFFTGGGYHRFANFDDDDDRRVMSVAEAFRRSVNLVFVRLMRDVVDHVIASSVPESAAILANRDHAGRRAILERAADREALADVRRLHGRYVPLSAAERRAHLIARRPLSTAQRGRLDTALAADDEHEAIDAAYGLGLDPLAVWVVRHLDRHPAATSDTIAEASRPVRLPAYRWLLRTRRKHTQDRRIRTELQREAFNRIHEQWRRTGYPFATLVPSYATALGSSADHPAGLAELMGIIAAGGVRRTTVEIERLRIAEGTPFETVFARDPGQPVRVMDQAVARALHAALRDVVENGTGRRARAAAYGSDGRPLAVAGKTGTGDNVAKSYDAEGNLVGARAVSRAATFAFILGDRHYGVVTAYVHGEGVDAYGFTSSLATEVFRHIAPALVPVVENEPYAWL